MSDSKPQRVVCAGQQRKVALKSLVGGVLIHFFMRSDIYQQDIHLFLIYKPED